jgi:FtsP/CotA-like multicopper oxidase with cupredoxin domain
VNTRIFALSGGMGQLRINGVTMDLNFINETVPLDVVEIWEVTSNMNMVHNFHIHATHFQIIERNGSAANVPANEQGFKDTVYLPPNETVKFIVKMVDYSSASTPDNAYMYHCHILEHEDAGMMGQFVVV